MGIKRKGMDEGSAKRSGRFKHILGSATERADPVLREFFKRGVGRDVIVRITLFRIVDITTHITFVLFHRSPPIEKIIA
jgi:hypothetical protein